MKPDEKLKISLIEELLQRIQTRKKELEPLVQQEKDLREKLEAYKGLYTQYLGDLETRQLSLVNYVNQLSAALEDAYQQTEDKGEAGMREAETAPEMPDSHSNVIDFASLPSKGPEIEQISGDQTSIDIPDIRGKKDRIFRFFSKRWHPDLLQKGGELMSVLTEAYYASEDAIEFLATLPWDATWAQRGSNESLKDQWDRLAEWCAYLEDAKERLKGRLEQYQFDWGYQFLKDWEAYENKQDYFAAKVEKLRKEIQDLEEEVDTLEQQLASIKAAKDGLMPQ